MEKIYNFFTLKMETPPSFGWFHLLFVLITIAVTTFLCIKFKDCEDRIFRRITLICWIIMVVFEIYKQLFHAATYENGIYTYNWYYFPFQLCSTPFYVLPFVAFMKDNKIRDYFTSFISTFAFFGGLVVFAYPNDVFVETIGINIQTMVHHGLQLVLGIYFAVYNRKRLGIKYYLKSIPVFIACLVLAVALNEIVHNSLVKIGNDDDFSMFYISPYVENHLPILSVVYAAVDWILFFLAYTVGFCIAAILMLYAMIGGIKLANLINSKVKNNLKAQPAGVDVEVQVNTDNENAQK